MTVSVTFLQLCKEQEAHNMPAGTRVASIKQPFGEAEESQLTL